MTFLFSIISGIIVMSITFGIMFLFAKLFLFITELDERYIPLFFIIITGFLLGLIIYASTKVIN